MGWNRGFLLSRGTLEDIACLKVLCAAQCRGVSHNEIHLRLVEFY